MTELFSELVQQKKVIGLFVDTCGDRFRRRIGSFVCLQVIEGIDAASPKSMIRHCREIGLINEDQTATIITMADDGNLTVHTYDEALAERMAARIRSYDGLLQLWG